MERKRPAIIAMQGDPCTGKTTIANYLAKKLRCSIIRFDDILDVISRGVYPPTPEKAETFISQTFDLIAQIVKTQTSLGMPIVVDSPLSRRSHLDRLVCLFIELHEQNSDLSLLIVECKPQIKYAWQTWFEVHGSSHDNRWYKPQSWPLDPTFTKDYMDDGIHPLVAKMVVDTTNHVPLGRVLAAVVDLTSSTKGRNIKFDEWRPIHRGTRDSCRGDHNALDKGKTVKYEPDRCSPERKKGTSRFCSDGHFVNIYKEEGINHKYATSCGVCLKPLTKSCTVYRCGRCPLAIHKSCAELAPREFTPESFPKFFKREPQPTYCFPQEHLCLSCKKKGKEFSYECESCIFETHLKCQLVPTILQHPTHKHWLSFQAKSDKRHSYLCAACWCGGNQFGYRCNEEHCHVNYHSECAFLPSLVREHEHGGYTHCLEIIYHREEELEDYLCSLCFKKMNPQAWYYYCKICVLSLHLDCAFMEFDQVMHDDVLNN